MKKPTSDIGAFEAILWYVIEDTVNLSLPDLSDQERFDNAMIALFGDMGGRPNRDDDTLLDAMQVLIENKKNSIRQAARKIVDAIPPDVWEKRKEVSKEICYARLQRKYSKRVKQQNFPTNIFEEVTAGWEDERREAAKQARKFMTKYWSPYHLR